ncbi:alpha/beta hydrolase [Streptomyces sp. NPDC059010]|uniref:alpha/beta hydrolase n=1 Tax=Streptomyces sp. NPDC059010 TaxID=3346695 RepID=UPI00368EB8E7
MASDFSRLMKQDFSDMEATAKAWRKLSTTMDSLTDRHRRQVTGPLYHSWQGDDAESALFYLEDVESRIGVVETEAMTIFSVLEHTRFWMEEAQRELRNAVSGAEEDDFEVDVDGWISDRVVEDLPRNSQVTAEARGALLQEHRARIDAALSNARKASNQGVRALTELNGDILTDPFKNDAEAESAQDTKKALKTLGSAPPQIPEDDPKAAAEWWKTLSPEQRQTYTTLYPKEIGATDGLPTDVRNDANRTVLAQDLNMAKFGNSKEGYPGESGETVNQRLHNALLLNDRLNAGDSAPKGKELYLLGYDSKDDGRAVIAMGNPDTAAHTGILVPGTNTTMENVPGQLERIDKLQTTASAQSDGESVAMVTWLGYDAPEAKLTDFNSVDDTGRAEDAAPDLRRFVAGIQASHDGSPSHTTVMGHSYGSTVVGAAAAGGSGLVADDVVVVGSPGMTVDEAGDLQMDPEHVWVGAAEDDFVRNHFAGYGLGADPKMTGFGGNNFRVDTSGHGGYWNECSESLNNQGAIIAGRQPTEVPKDGVDGIYFPVI